MSASVGETAAPDRTMVGILWMVATGIFFVAVTGIVRHVGSDLPAPEAAFIRYALGLGLMAPAFVALFRRRPPMRSLSLYAFRGVVHGAGVMLWFYAMARISIAEVTALGYTAPVFVAILAAIFLGEKMRLRRMTAIFAGFFGAMIIIRPGFEEVSSGQLAQLCAAPLFAVSFIIAKKLTATARPTEIVAMLSLGCTLMLAPFAWAEWREPSLNEVLWLGLTAILATMGHYCMTRALEAAPITVTQPISFLQLLWATILGVVVFGEPVDVWVIAGGAVIVAAATYIAQREAVARRREAIETAPH